MSNYKRVYVPGGLYFFTLVTYRRNPVFSEVLNIDILRNAFRYVKSRNPFSIEAIVILPDHLHCLIQLPKDDSDYSGRWREIKKRVTRHIGGNDPIWQRRFWEHLIRDEEDWLRHMDYIHYNPVKHGLVDRPFDWCWSSFGNMVELGLYDENWGDSEPNSVANMNLE